MSSATAPAPWKLKGLCWVFPVSRLPSTSALPEGFAGSIEAESLSSGGDFVGGLGSIMILSLTETNIGPYDELLYSPGKWKYKDGSIGFRVTRIFASTAEATETGRRNWNDPMSLADFSITTSGSVTTIKVTLPGATEPFFHVQIKPVPLLSRMPMPLTLALGKSTQFVQPPLPAGNRPEEIATNVQWASFSLLINQGTARLQRIVPQMQGGKVGDGKSFPAIAPWKLGLYASNANINLLSAVFSDDYVIPVSQY